MNYDCDYFINKFSEIPYDKWTIGRFKNPDNLEQRCAMGHCIYDEVTYLSSLFQRYLPLQRAIESQKCLYMFVPSIPEINDGNMQRYQQDHPKDRILAALWEIKSLVDKEPEPEIEVPSVTTTYAVLH